MKKHIVAALILTLTLSAFAGNERLIGAWKSNKETTVAYLKTHTKLTDVQLGIVAQALGKMTITFDRKNMTLKTDKWQFASPYKITSETKDFIIIESNDPQTQKPSKSLIEFDGNGLWLPDDRIPGYKERFDRLEVAAH